VTRRERFWLWCGFGYPSDPVFSADEVEDRRYVIRSALVLRLSWRDRLRFLAGWDVAVVSVVQTQGAPVSAVCKMAASVLPPSRAMTRPTAGGETRDGE